MRAETEPAIGSFISHYQIVGLAGSGGMGNVYKARDTRLDRLVALKFPRHQFSDGVLREARLIASVSHRSICRLLDIGESGPVRFLVLEYVEGATLAERLAHAPLSLTQAVDWGVEILNAIGAIHGRGLVHGDLKPSNIMLTADGPRILDFGLAALLHRAESEQAETTANGQSKAMHGTPGYMAPEQVNGATPTMLSDLFATGAVLYEAVTGAPAFPGPGTLARLTAVAQDSPAPLSGGPEWTEVDRVLRRALAKAPAARFASAAEFADELLQCARGRSRNASGSVPRLLVLPFEVATGENSDVLFLAEALPDAITSELLTSPHLQVRSAAVGKRYGPAPDDLHAIAAETSVNLMLKGTIRFVDGQTTLSTQLLRVPDGAVLSGTTHSVPLRDVFAAQNAVIQNILQAIGSKEEAGPPAAVSAKSSSAAEAYELYVRANLAAQDPRRLHEACELYSQSVAVHSGYAPAWARLGRLYRILAKYASEPVRNMELGRHALNHALTLDPDLYLAHSYYAQHDADEGRPVEALIRLLRLSIAAPQNADVLCALTYVCRLCGLYTESIRYHKEARRLDPTVSTSVNHTFFQTGQYVQCLETYSGQGIGYIEPLALDGLGMHEEALARVSENLSRVAGFTLGALYVRSLHSLWSGDLKQAQDLMETAGQRYFLGPEENYYFARKRIVANLDGGTAQLRKAVENGFYGLHALLLDPWLSSIRETAEFRQTLALCEEGHHRACREYQSIAPR